MINLGASLSYLGIYALLLLWLIEAQDLPYNPSRILLSANDSDIAYVFLPSASTLESKLLSLNISATIDASNLSYNTVTADLPFASDSSQAFIPVIDDEGDISVYTGDCALGIGGSTLWKFTPDAIGNGTWTKSTLEVSSAIASSDQPGANYLNGGFTFSTLLGNTSSLGAIYIFGGMCPTIKNSSESTWQANANYSNHMLQFSPSTDTEYMLELSSLSAPPISEAGFSLTPLQSTTSNSSSGTLTQQQNFILLGGQTETAFTNFSQVAIFSLPEGAWSFQNIDSSNASSSTDTELAVKSINDYPLLRDRTATTIDSRSGHTAVLTEDGSRMVVFGGWVGEITTLANPQLLLLELGAGYGGSGDWAWTIPDTSGESITDGTGIYGHGAVMLPGNVMMVLGGYSISSSSATSPKRSTTNNDAYFFNATSMTWTSSYKNPSVSKPNTSLGGTSTTTAKEVGLGVGLSCGFAAVIIAGCAYMWYSRRLRRQRRHTREKDLRALSYGAATYTSVDANHDPFRSPQNGSHSSPYYNYNNAYLSDNVPNYENLNQDPYSNADADFGVNSPTSAGIRRNSTYKGKGTYQLAPNFDARGRSNSLGGPSGPIHPIIEADEEELPFTLAGVGLDSEPDSPSQPQALRIVKRKQLSRPGTGNGEYPESLHFDEKERDPLRSHPLSLRGAASGGNLGGGHHSIEDRSSSNPSPESSGNTDPATAAREREREAEIKEWVNEWAAADALLSVQSQMQSHSSNYAGRISPTRYRRSAGINGSGSGNVVDEKENTSSGSGRTESNISESARSAISNLTLSVGRSLSQRSTSLSAFLTGAGTTRNTFSSSSPTAISPVFDRDRSYSGYEGLRGGGGGGRNPDSSGTSFTTALTHNSFPALRAEGESLLPRPLVNLDDLEFPILDEKPSPNKLRRNNQRSISWLGSLRRVLTGSGNSPSSKDSKKISELDSPLYWSDVDTPVRRREGAGIGYAYGGSIGDGNSPRRTVSAGATLWRRKQGKVDWEDSEQSPMKPKPRPGTSRHSSTARSTALPGTRMYDDPFITPADEKEMGFASGKGKGRESDEDEWDIERAVENRVVQVMFTVPKERLRVVNYDVEDDVSEVDQNHDSDMPQDHDRVQQQQHGQERRHELEEIEGNGQDPRNVLRAAVDEDPRDRDRARALISTPKEEERKENKSPSRVREMVERFEGRATPSPTSSRSPARSPVRK